MGSNWAYSPPQPFAFSYEIASNSGPAGMPCTCCILARFCCRLCWEEVNVCARREQKPSLLGLCRAAANFRASECNRACSYCRAQPKISRQKSQSKFSCKRVLFSCKRVQNRTCSGYAERSRKCQEIEFAHIAERSRKSRSKNL